MTLSRTFTFLLFSLACCCSGAEILTGAVVAITDGDTLTVLTSDKRQVKVRLAGIDAPENAQPFSKASKQNLSILSFQKTVRVEWNKLDRYGRTIGKIFVDELDVNLQQVRDGFAWWYRKYANTQTAEDQREYEAAETSAREANLGLWSDREPRPPWEWRSFARVK